MDHQKQFFVKILDATDYEGNKEVFAETFTYLIYDEAVYNLLHSLPISEQKKYAEKWKKNENNPAALTSMVKHLFSDKQIEAAIQSAAKQAIIDYLKSLGPLTEEQRSKLLTISQEFSPLSN